MELRYLTIYVFNRVWCINVLCKDQIINGLILRFASKKNHCLESCVGRMVFDAAAHYISIKLADN